MTELDQRPDTDLLTAFAATHAEAPFAELVRRHSPLVLGVCRRVLGPAPDAEDAAQAVFLTLAQKASSLRGRGAVAGWLHRVAWNVARNARRADARRRAHEKGAVQMASRTESGLMRVRERLLPLLDQELAALPAVHRAPLVLHHLEGVPATVAAERLRCSPGAYAVRLTRAREALRTRLARLGVTLSAGTLAAAITPSAFAAEASTGFVAATAKAGALWASGGTAALGNAASATAVELTKGAMHMFAMAQVKTAVAAAAVFLLVPAAGYVAVGALSGDRPRVEAPGDSPRSRPVADAKQPAPPPRIDAAGEDRRIPVPEAIRAEETAPTGTKDIDPLVKASVYGDKVVRSYHGETMPWAQFKPRSFGSSKIVFNGEGVRPVGKVPAPGVHPRIFFSPEDLPDLRRRLKETRGGQEAYKNLLSFANAMKLTYDDKADYAKPDWVNGGWNMHGRAPLWLMGPMGLPNPKRENYYALLVEGKAPEKTFNKDNPPSSFFKLASTEAFRCLIEEDAAAARDLAKAVVTAIRLEQERRAKEDKPVKPGLPPDPSTNRLAASNVGLIYDFIYNWMTPEQRTLVHDELVTLSAWHDNYGTFNNAEASRSNWACFSYWVWDLLAIEGEPGFNPPVRSVIREARRFSA
jgi:RNA polymerase sigma factor (sigma-70 family)